MRKNKNRGYQKLRVWNDAIDYYVKTFNVFRGFSFELKRVASQAIASADSVHRNISEGYIAGARYTNISTFSTSRLAHWVNRFQEYKPIGNRNK